MNSVEWHPISEITCLWLKVHHCNLYLTLKRIEYNDRPINMVKLSDEFR